MKEPTFKILLILIAVGLSLLQCFKSVCC